MAENWLAKAKMVPLAVATGAGAEMRQSLGTAVIFGMLDVTLFGLLCTPTFYAVVWQLSGNASSQKGRIYGPNPQPDHGPQQPGGLRQRANAGLHASNAARSSGDQRTSPSAHLDRF